MISNQGNEPNLVLEIPLIAHHWDILDEGRGEQLRVVGI
jgi:hypothetical protein